jgi:hypothetical protein
MLAEMLRVENGKVSWVAEGFDGRQAGRRWGWYPEGRHKKPGWLRSLSSNASFKDFHKNSYIIH